jgi:putative NAD(P)-binding protein
MRSNGLGVPTVPGGTSNRVSVGVIGGGIGGLSAALSLLQAGFDVQVYEQAPMLGLHHLGLAGNLTPGPACRRWNGISGAGTTAAPCCARRSPQRWRPPSASPNTRSTGPTCWLPWPTPFPPTGSISTTSSPT